MEFLKKAFKTYPVIFLAVVATVIFCLVAGVRFFTNDQRSPEMTLEKYYDAFYETQSVETLKETVTDLLHEAVDSQYGMAYMGDATMLSLYAQGVMDTVGYEDFKVDVDVLSNQRSTAQVLGNVRQTYPDATAYHILKFRVTFSGEMGSHSQTGETCLVKRSDGRWYMVEAQIFLYDEK